MSWSDAPPPAGRDPIGRKPTGQDPIGRAAFRGEASAAFRTLTMVLPLHGSWSLGRAAVPGRPVVRVVIDGVAHDVPWGVHRFQVPADRPADIEVYLPWVSRFDRRVGFARAILLPEHMPELEYAAPNLIGAPGVIGAPGTVAPIGTEGQGIRQRIMWTIIVLGGFLGVAAILGLISTLTR